MKQQDLVDIAGQEVQDVLEVDHFRQEDIQDHQDDLIQEVAHGLDLESLMQKMRIVSTCYVI